MNLVKKPVGNPVRDPVGEPYWAWTRKAFRGDRAGKGKLSKAKAVQIINLGQPSYRESVGLDQGRLCEETGLEKESFPRPSQS